MMQNWGFDERRAGRRLVHFWRKTSLSSDGQLTNVESGFEAIGQQEYQEQRMRDSVGAIGGAYNSVVGYDSMTAPHMNAKDSSIVVSCTHWPEENDCFITSVDCIRLLEVLIGINFWVDEKNRIRRNLEGLRPINVSRGGERTGFFRQIMAYPYPRPRNIEKDVKLFSWRSLQFALRKVLGKYTLSFTTME